MKLIFSLLLAVAALLACGVLAQEALPAQETNTASQSVDLKVLPVTRLRLARQHDPAFDSVMNENAKILTFGFSLYHKPNPFRNTPQTEPVHE